VPRLLARLDEFIAVAAQERGDLIDKRALFHTAARERVECVFE